MYILSYTLTATQLYLLQETHNSDPSCQVLHLIEVKSILGNLRFVYTDNFCFKLADKLHMALYNDRQEDKCKIQCGVLMTM